MRNAQAQPFLEDAIVIDCPICHVKNNDDARFCAECGQRLSGGAQSSVPTEPVQPLRSPQQQPPQQQAPQRLHSPLLSDAGPQADATHHGAGLGPNSASGEVNRLRQMSTRQQQEQQGQPPAQPYKNPFDPRNAAPPDMPPSAGGAGPNSTSAEAPKKLRSPLLSGEEFDEDYIDDEPQQQQPGGRGLRSPLLGGGEGGGGALRSPMLGGGGRQLPQDEYDEEPQPGGGLRSPLLGGGGGGGYGGSDRRKLPDSPYPGQERRRGGLRSPMLSSEEGEYYEEEYYEDEPLDEDNPNVLRSPLLAAKRPLSDRPKPEPSPQASNLQHPPRPGQMPDLGPNVQNPNSSYSNLRSIRGQGSAPPAVPPAPFEQPAQLAQPAPNQPQAQQQAQPQQWPAGGPPTNVPQSFLSGFSGAAATPPVGPSTAAQPVRPPEADQFSSGGGTGGGINVQPPTPSRSMPPYQAGIDQPTEDVSRAKGRSKILSQYDSDDADEDYAPTPYGGSRYGMEPSSGPPSPLPKIIGAIAVLVLIVKLWAFSQFAASQWMQTPWLVADQVVMIGTLICLAVLAFTRRN